jgi:hypothetical protein
VIAGSKFLDGRGTRKSFGAGCELAPKTKKARSGGCGETAHSASEIFHCLRALVAWYFKALDCFRKLLAIYCYHSKILPSSITYGGMV